MNETTFAALKSYARHFLGACLAAFAVAGGDIFTLNAEGLKAIFTAGVVVEQSNERQRMGWYRCSGYHNSRQLCWLRSLVSKALPH
jgi:hypothetical protein